MPSSAGKPKHPWRHHQDIAGNTPSKAKIQGWTVPVPFYDMQSWEDSASPKILTAIDGGYTFEEASWAPAAQPTWVCRAAPGSDVFKGH